MAWIETTRTKYERRSDRYQSDLTANEWSLLDGLFGGSPCKWLLREIVNAIFYLLSSGGSDGCCRRIFRRRVPSTVCSLNDGTLIASNYHLIMLARESLGRETSPTAGAIDTQLVKTTESECPSHNKPRIPHNGFNVKQLLAGSDLLNPVSVTGPQTRSTQGP